jgi:hypothetical protein
MARATVASTFHDIGRGHRPVPQPVGQRFAVDQVADENVPRPFFQHVVKCHDVDVFEARDLTGLRQHLVNLKDGQRSARPRHLRGDVTPEPKVVGTPHIGVPATPDQCLQHIAFGKGTGLLRWLRRAAHPCGLFEQADAISHGIEQFGTPPAQFLGGDRVAALTSLFPCQQQVGDPLLIRHPGVPPARWPRPGEAEPTATAA